MLTVASRLMLQKLFIDQGGARRNARDASETASPQDDGGLHHDARLHHRDALIHWRRFRACLAAMPPDAASSLWRVVSAEVAAL
jgi:hypothetical protein